MGMGFGGHIRLGADLNDGTVGVSPRPIFAKYSWRKLLGGSYLPVSSDDPLDITPERNAVFGANRHGGTALSRGISEKSGKEYDTESANDYIRQLVSRGPNGVPALRPDIEWSSVENWPKHVLRPIPGDNGIVHEARSRCRAFTG